MVNTKPEHDLRLAVMHETSSDDAETQISSWLKSFDDVEFVKKRNQMRDTVFVSTKSADEALDDIMSSEMGADSAPEKVKLSIIDYSTYSESLGVNTEYELIVKPIGAVTIEGNVDSYCDDALELFEGSLMMPDTDASGESKEQAPETAETVGGSSVAELSGEAEVESESEDSDSEDSDEGEGSGSTLYSGRHWHASDDSAAAEPDEYAASNKSDDARGEDEFASEEDRQRAVYAKFQRNAQDEMQKLIDEDTNGARDDDDGAVFSESSQETQAQSAFADSRTSSFEVTFDESDVPEFAESSELESTSDLERDDRLTFALDNIIPHVKNDVLFGDVGFDDSRLSQLSPQSRLSLEMSINQANSFLANSRIDAESEAESVTNDELRDEVFSAIKHFSESSDENVDAYADAYAEAVSFANAIQNAADEIVDEYNAREDAWVAKQLDALREIYRQNNPDRTGEAIDALIEKNTPKYAELEAAANSVRPAAVAAVVRFLRKKNTKTSDAASELTRFFESRKIASAQLEENFRTLQDIDAANGFSFSDTDADARSAASDAVDTSVRNNDETRFVPVSELGTPNEDAPSTDNVDEPGDADDSQDDTVADDVNLSPAVSALADDEDENSDETNVESDEDDVDEATEADDSEDSDDLDDSEADEDATEESDDDPMSAAELDESLKLNDNDDDTGEVSDFDEEGAAELPQDFMDDDADEATEAGNEKPSKKVIAIAVACAVGLIGAGTLFTGFVWPGFFKSDDAQVTQGAGPEGASATLPSGAANSAEQEPTDASGLYRTGDTIRVVVRGSIQNLTVSEFTQGGGAIAENASGDKFRITQTQLDRYADENPEKFEGRETLTEQAPAEPESQPAENNDDSNEAESAQDGGPADEQSEGGEQ